jgi:serine phosphatase RsbU (regulator of sigma subunit)
MLEVVRQNRQASAREIIHSLYAAAREFSAGGIQRDDITAIVVKVLDAQ